MERSENRPKLHQVVRTWSPYDFLSSSCKGSLRAIGEHLGFSAEFGTLLRYELDMALLRTWCHLSSRYKRHVKDLQKRSGLLIHLGCGNTLKPNWVNVDCYPPPAASGCEIFVTDIRQGLPLASNSVSAIYSEHFFEHIPIETTMKTILPECFRLLESGGVVRVGVPDGQLWIEAYATGALIGDGATPMMRIYDIARHDNHKFLWDYNTLQHSFEQAGFTDCRKASAADSAHSVFLDMDQTDPLRVAQTVYIEARKP